MEPGHTMVALAFIGTIGIVLYPLARALGQRLESKTAQTPALAAGHDPRLERMEQAIDAIAIEVERIAEAQRFQTRLLSERANERALGAGDPLRRSEI